MKKIDSAQELKKVLLNILEEFASFCDNNNLKYYLMGGTLIGVIRHQGFIPWDDDIDLAMPRPDYKRFIELTRNGFGTHFNVLSPECSKKYVYPFVKVCDNNTLMIEKRHVSAAEYGVFIDVFPIDGIPDSDEKLRKHLKKIKKLKDMNKYAGTSVFTSRNILLTLPRLCMVFACKLLGSGFFVKRINRLAQKYDYDNSDLIAVTVWGYGVKEKLLKKEFVPQILGMFEGKQFSISAGYDKYLHNLYGDYMTFPPEEEQKSHHDFDVYWRD